MPAAIARRQRFAVNAAAWSPSQDAERTMLTGAVKRPVERQTVSKPCFWSMQALQAIDFVRLYFRKIDF